jgi:hypothetical protein
MMHVVYKKGLELLRKTVTNNGQPQAEDDHGKVAVKRLLIGQ